MRAPGLPNIIDLVTWNFVQEKSSGPGRAKFDCGDDVDCEGAANMLCARNITGTPDYNKWWNFEVCMYADQIHIPHNAPACAAKHGIPVDTLAACVAGELGLELLHRSALETAAGSVGWTPWIDINSTVYTPGKNYLQIVCDAFSSLNPPPVQQPSGCNTTSPTSTKQLEPPSNLVPRIEHVSARRLLSGQ
mmetsp:Transcript_35944/g.43401  ORF Transcript_35944/g.43401 Transcript_35944/m.43401 type:complete len:191 (+) Transcript_35944:303-875(+)|eukprot:CAMPEP_0197861110 /NCGR_PEP_ID=MMETSP1438-20131217/36963_1 /TAXON_ID=1461541 /ORGANISM="Pterosperma sp., Strain CCMP1384" /LENGTH=190 /DNA_ID=CAMNT_0043478187 /DNA_START=271 /DNA_END=843 /DNA_ORIENTATION=-